MYVFKRKLCTLEYNVILQYMIMPVTKTNMMLTNMIFSHDYFLMFLCPRRHALLNTRLSL